MATSDETSEALRIVASFEQPDAAREAMIALEKLGIDAEAIRLLNQDPRVQVGGLDRSGELDAARSVARNYAKGAVVSAVGVAVLAAVIVLAIGARPRPLAVALALVGGGIAGFVLGGFLNAARRLPVNEDALDTYTIDPRESEPVEVEVILSDPSLYDRSASVCREHHALNIERDG